ncbi:hypothetical protein IL38_24035 [Actinopolyspora erythraea]|uniref:4Fe-4S ferredoxin-type domain-containing protein n=2 Tax=Actinopolyspora erythraea TaxID=414996 RepID=A0ABR4WYB1_9ACTN|nr:hypothetical protein IL38_24035 [Actinopolyspora erythraea]
MVQGGTAPALRDQGSPTMTISTVTTASAGPSITGVVAEATCACGAFLAWERGSGWCHIADLCATCYGVTEHCPEAAEHGRFVLLAPDGARPCPVVPITCLVCDEVLEADALRCFDCGQSRCCGCCLDEADDAADLAYEWIRDQRCH